LVSSRAINAEPSIIPPSTGTAARPGPAGVDGVGAAGGDSASTGRGDSVVSVTLSSVTGSGSVDAGAASAGAALPFEPEDAFVERPPLDGVVGRGEPDTTGRVFPDVVGGATVGGAAVVGGAVGVGGEGGGESGSSERTSSLATSVCRTRSGGSGT
jgi:hypothetical protein